MMIRNLALAAAALAAMPANAQDAFGLQDARGSYLVYAEDSGAAFVSREPSLVETGVWPLEFHYFQDGETVGTARMSGTADCNLGVVSGRLTHVNGAPIPAAEAASVPQFSFDRAATESGDQAIVNFICGSGAPASSAERPIARSIAATVEVFRRLTALGLSPEVSAQLAVRDAEEGAALARNAVAADQQAAAIAALSAEAN